MWRPALLVVLGLVSTVFAINRSVYKVVLNQKGFTQFVQYDVETPPIREFTFCTWLKLYSFQTEQSIFTYIVNGNKRVVRLWLDSGGRHLKLLFNELELSSVPVEVGENVWRHVCLSYQSDFGAWALYLDSRLLNCEVSQKLQFFVIPGGGSVILGYGTTEQGSSTGLEGEIFGANMILSSTIGRNYTIKNHPLYVQKPFQRNKLRESKNIDYVVLKNLHMQESPKIVKTTNSPSRFNNTKVQIPYIEDVGAVQNNAASSTSNESEILDLVMNSNPRLSSVENPWTDKSKSGGWQSGKFKTQFKPGIEQSSSDTQDFPMISEFETPPPPLFGKTIHVAKSKEISHKTFMNVNEAPNVQPYKNEYNKKTSYYDIPEIEIPPPLEKDAKVYGQWTSSKYAGSVLNYLKSINFYKKEKKVPPTIPLIKLSDNFPYASNLNTRVVRPPTNLQKRNMLVEKRLQDQYQPPSLRRKYVQKRELKPPQINVKIIRHDIRSEILKSHAKTHPLDVEITNRGETKKRINRDSKSNRYVRDNELKGFHAFKTQSMFNVLPFLKSFEYFTDDSEYNTIGKTSDDMYAKSFTSANKWHNIQTYNNDYTPRRVPDIDNNSTLEQQISEANRKRPAIRLKYKPETNEIIHENNEEPIVKGRQLAKDVSNQSDNNKGKVSILKYNHGFLPGHSETIKTTKSLTHDADLKNKSQFHKHVKIGNALNERHVIGDNEEQKKHSFLGGDKRIPDINRYRSDIDNEKDNVPASLKPRVCRNIELLDHLLYVHPDGSIQMSRIVSPFRTKNIALEFVIQNYKKCSLDGSPLESNIFLLIDWSKTPLRLFGGAVAKRTKDLCGFFK